ncbi:nitroreductase family protein [Streptomyces africanus]|uniref:nitroreductase family protein n=1 Tax=Streptomyces africanus TaxID=231024 RepID=UPI0027D8E611|nr:nitroreductase family protein [Streptomyces africanus]
MERNRLARHRITLHRHRALPTLAPAVPAHRPVPFGHPRVLEDARTAPSNSNTQPWTVRVVSGAARDALAKELLQAEEEDGPTRRTSCSRWRPEGWPASRRPYSASTPTPSASSWASPRSSSCCSASPSAWLARRHR